MASGFWWLVEPVRRFGSGVGTDGLGELVASFPLAASRGQFLLKMQPFSRFCRQMQAIKQNANLGRHLGFAHFDLPKKRALGCGDGLGRCA